MRRLVRHLLSGSAAFKQCSTTRFSLDPQNVELKSELSRQQVDENLKCQHRNNVFEIKLKIFMEFSIQVTI